MSCLFGSVNVVGVCCLFVCVCVCVNVVVCVGLFVYGVVFIFV